MTDKDAERLRLQGCQPSSYGTNENDRTTSPADPGTEEQLKHDQNTDTRREEEVNHDLGSSGDGSRRCSRPYLVEMPMFLYFLAYKACLPLQEQFVFLLVSVSYTDDDHLLDSGHVAMVSSCESSSSSSLIDTSSTSQQNISIFENISIAEMTTLHPFQDKIQDEASQLLCYLNISRTVPALITTLFILAYTDTLGRKLGLFLPGVTGFIKSVIFICVIYFRSSYYWLFIGTFIEGLGGSHMVMQSSSYAYIADTVPTINRSFRFAVVQGVLYAATSLGNLGIGYCLQLGYLNSFTIIALVYLTSCLYVLVFLPESKTCFKPERTPADHRGVCSPIVAAFRVFDIYRLPEGERKSRLKAMCGEQTVGPAKLDQEKPKHATLEARRTKEEEANLQVIHQEYYDDINELEHHIKRILNLRLLLIVFCCDAMILYGRNDVDVLYMMGQPFCWNSIKIGYYQALKYSLKAVFSLAMVPVLQLWFSDACMGVAACLSGLLSNVLMGLATSSFMLWLVPEVAMVSSVVTPLAEAMMSKMVSADHQGALFASIGVTEALSSLVSTSSFNLIYSATVYWMNGFVFQVFAALYFLSLCIFLYFCIHFSFFKIADQKLKIISE